MKPTELYIVSIITGKVFDDNGTPIKGVRITINNHKKFGFTYTSLWGLVGLGIFMFIVQMPLLCLGILQDYWSLNMTLLLV